MIPDEPKINKAISEKIEPLYEVWKREANWTEEEAIVMYHRLFDETKPNDTEILKSLTKQLKKNFVFYDRTKVSKIYKKARKKLNKILP